MHNTEETVQSINEYISYTLREAKDSKFDCGFRNTDALSVAEFTHDVLQVAHLINTILYSRVERSDADIPNNLIFSRILCRYGTAGPIDQILNTPKLLTQAPIDVSKLRQIYADHKYSMLPGDAKIKYITEWQRADINGTDAVNQIVLLAEHVVKIFIVVDAIKQGNVDAVFQGNKLISSLEELLLSAHLQELRDAWITLFKQAIEVGYDN